MQKLLWKWKMGHVSERQCGDRNGILIGNMYE